MNESPPSEAEQAEEIVDELLSSLNIDWDEEIAWTYCPSRVILALYSELKNLEQRLDTIDVYR